MKRSKYIVIYFCCLLFFIGANARPILKTYSVGTENIEYYPHFGKKSATSESFEGYAQELLDAFAKDQEIRLKYVPMPIKRLYISLIKHQSIDFKYPDNPNWTPAIKQQVKVYYSTALDSYIDGTFVRIDSPIRKRSDIGNLGLIRGFTPEPYLKEIAAGDINVYEYTHSNLLLQALVAKRIDAFYINVDVATYQMQRDQTLFQQIHFDPQLPYVEGDYHLSTILYPKMIDLINEFVKENPEFINRLQYKYRVKHQVKDKEN